MSVKDIVDVQAPVLVTMWIAESSGAGVLGTRAGGEKERIKGVVAGVKK